MSDPPPHVRSPVFRLGMAGLQGIMLDCDHREDRCAAGFQVHVDACLSMSAMLLWLCVQVWQQVCHQSSKLCSLNTRYRRTLAMPLFTVIQSAVALHFHWHAVRV